MNYDTFTIEDDEPETYEIAPQSNREARARARAAEFEKNRFQELHWPSDGSLGCSAWRARRQAKAEAQELYHQLLEEGRTAKDLAQQAGLTGRDATHAFTEAKQVRQLIEWFRASAMPFLEKHAIRIQEEDGIQDKADIEAYYESRKVRYRFSRQVWHQRKGDHNDRGLGLYSWRKDGKFYRSWLGNEPLATPRQIAAKMLVRYPGSDIVIIHTGFSNTNTAGASAIGGLVVPTYEVFITDSVPRSVLAGERLYLDFGRELDLEDASRAEQELRAGNLDPESYADFIARLCREAPQAEDWNDYQAGRWEELKEDTRPAWRPEQNKPMPIQDPKDGHEYYGFEFETFEIDDTRDDQRLATYEGMFAGRDAWTAADTGNRIWDDESTTFGSVDFGSDQESGRDVQMLLGLSTQQIEHAFGEVGDDATIGDFMKALPRREATEQKKQALRQPDEDAITF